MKHLRDVFNSLLFINQWEGLLLNVYPLWQRPQVYSVIVHLQFVTHYPRCKWFLTHPHCLSDVWQQRGGRGQRRCEHGSGQPHHSCPVLPPAEATDDPKLPQTPHRGWTQDAAQILCTHIVHDVLESFFFFLHMYFYWGGWTLLLVLTGGGVQSDWNGTRDILQTSDRGHVSLSGKVHTHIMTVKTLPYSLTSFSWVSKFINSNCVIPQVSTSDVLSHSS